MKYPIDTTIMIHNKEWRIAEHRMGRGREYRFTLTYEHTDGTFDTIRLTESDIDNLLRTNALP